jgi:ABC-type glycerol-3-phosphate transport system substrate-binding protein
MEEKPLLSFQNILLGACMFFVVFGVLIFSGALPIGSINKKRATELEGTLIVWGTQPQDKMRIYLDTLSQNNGNNIVYQYVEQSEDSIDTAFVNAIANGLPPDLIIMPHTFLSKHQNKLTLFPYESFPRRAFEDTYVSGAQLFLRQNGMLGVPLFVDPLVMFYNRDLVNRAGFVRPPNTWQAIAGAVSRLTVRDGDGGILVATLPFGTISNVPFAKDIISLLVMQAGDRMVVPNPQGGYQSVFGFTGNTDDGSDSQNLTTLAIEFFMSFSNPQKDTYSWNRRAGNPYEAFLGGQLVFYPSYASELFKIRDANPNLNFDIMEMPQVGTIQTRLTFGKIYGVTVPKSGLQQALSLQGLQQITSPEGALLATQTLSLPPARRDILANPLASDPYIAVLYSSALIATGWIDPDPFVTKAIFSEMVESIASGKEEISAAVRTASDRMQQIVR